MCTSGATNGATITLVATGTCTVQASQAGNATYAAATPVTRSFTVSKASQTITFAALSNKTLAQSPVTVSATASSGLAGELHRVHALGVHLGRDQRGHHHPGGHRHLHRPGQPGGQRHLRRGHPGDPQLHGVEELAGWATRLSTLAVSCQGICSGRMQQSRCRTQQSRLG